MTIVSRLLLAVVIGLAVGFGYRAYDKARGAEWVVSPQQIAAAKASGKPGFESSPDTVTVLPIRSEIADALPFEWILAGVGAGGLVFVATRRRRLVR